MLSDERRWRRSHQTKSVKYALITDLGLGVLGCRRRKVALAET
jgi:hypothetical protein